LVLISRTAPPLKKKKRAGRMKEETEEKSKHLITNEQI
jgi:hypothetical protein